MTGMTTRASDRIASGIVLEGLAVGQARNVVSYSDGTAGGTYGVSPDRHPAGSFNADRM